MAKQREGWCYGVLPRKSWCRALVLVALSSRPCGRRGRAVCVRAGLRACATGRLNQTTFIFLWGLMVAPGRCEACVDRDNRHLARRVRVKVLPLAAICPIVDHPAAAFPMADPGLDRIRPDHPAARAARRAAPEAK